ncbi:MAG: hypothetical protein ACYC3A_10685 [Halothiobacillus sp.]
MKKFASLSAAGALFACNMAIAGPADYVYTPNVEYGERELDFKFGTWEQNNDQSQADHSLGLGYGVTPWWFTEIYMKGRKINHGATKYEAAEWENKFQLTETGRYPVDVGFLLEIERPADHSEGWEVKYGPLFQTDFGLIQLNTNFLFKKKYRSDLPSVTEMHYQWQAKYRWMPAFEFGLQGFGQVGKWDDWAPAEQRSSRAGPAIFGKIPLGGRQAIKYNAAWLVGTSSAAPNRNVRLQVEYEF